MSKHSQANGESETKSDESETKPTETPPTKGTSVPLSDLEIEALLESPSNKIEQSSIDETRVTETSHPHVTETSQAEKP